MYSTVYDDVINDVNTELRVLKKTQPSRAAHIKKNYTGGWVFFLFSQIFCLLNRFAHRGQDTCFLTKRKIENWQIYGQAYISMT